jgi:peptidoglycan/LPS O-acetylase OafA/YrhL
LPPKLSANLDLLRTVAVLLVLAQHLLRRFQTGNDFPPIGTFGVLIFFVHTCLVLMYSMERSGLDGSSLFPNFYLRRAFRIYPLSMLAVLTAVALHLDSGIHGVPGLSHSGPVGLGRVLSNLFLVQNLVKPGSIINVLWSLPFEVQMYVFLPFLFLWIRKKRGAVWRLSLLWLFSLVVAVIQIKLAAITGPASLAKRLSLLRMIPNFLPGVMAFVLPHTPRIKSFLWPIFIFVLVGIYMALPAEAMGWALCLILGLGIPWFGEIQTNWLRKASNRIATYSYGIYLSHQFCIWYVDDPLGAFSWWVKIPVLTLLLVGAPILLYHFIEKPLIRVGADLAARCSARTLAKVDLATSDRVTRT